MYDVEYTEVYLKWYRQLKDKRTRHRIEIAVMKISYGHFGDHKKIRGYTDIFEVRLDIGPGYRLYYTIQGGKIIILLIGGTKKTQTKDIAKAAKILDNRRQTYEK